MKTIQTPILILLIIIGVGSADAQSTRPTPIGVAGGNAAVNTTSKACFDFVGTLGSVVADQNGTQYVLSAAHVLATGATSFLATGSAAQITQPDPVSAAGFNCNLITPALVNSIQVATLSTVVPFFTGSVVQTDAAIAQVLPGMVSTSIKKIPAFSGLQLQVLKKRLQLQKTGAQTGNTIGHVVKTNVTATEDVCQHVVTNGNGESQANCGLTKVKIGGLIEIKPGNFAKRGDSGSLVLTAGPCPQPVGVVVAGNSDVVDVEPIGTTMNALMSAGGYSILTVVPGGGGCTPATSQVQDANDDNSADFTLQDASVADPDVTQVQSLLPSFEASLPTCAWLSFCFEGFCDPDVQGVAIDMSGTVAKLDVIVPTSANLDPNHECLPANFEGVPVNQSVVEEINNNTSDTSDQSSGSY